LSALYRAFLEGGYDGVDRIVLNAYFPMGQSGGGFRVWWRARFGSDDNLDDNHLMRMAGRFSRRLRGWAKANGVPVVYGSPGDEKHKMAEAYQATHQIKPGRFLGLVAKAPALVWEAQKTGTGKLGPWAPTEPWPDVNHYSVQILDPDWGHVTIKRSGPPPFGAQVILNGHDSVAAQAQKAGIGFTKQENGFTAGDDAPPLAKVADTLSERETAGHVRQLCERWIYSPCRCFALDLEEQEKSTFQYRHSAFQMEYSRHLLLHSGRQREEICQALMGRTRAPRDLDRIKTIFGDKHRPHRDPRKKNPPRWGRSLPCFGEIVTRWRGIRERFLHAGGCLGACFVSDDTLENRPLPAQVGQTKVGGIDFTKPGMRQLAEAILALSTSPTSPAGFTASDLAQKVRKMNGQAQADYGPRRAASGHQEITSQRRGQCKIQSP
jgi:hypothetical protein